MEAGNLWTVGQKALKSTVITWKREISLFHGYFIKIFNKIAFNLYLTNCMVQGVL
jgi:hypothetical protein